MKPIWIFTVLLYTDKSNVHKKFERDPSETIKAFGRMVFHLY